MTIRKRCFDGRTRDPAEDEREAQMVAVDALGPF